jgi:hypothetical protein
MQSILRDILIIKKGKQKSLNKVKMRKETYVVN